MADNEIWWRKPGARTARRRRRITVALIVLGVVICVAIIWYVPRFQAAAVPWYGTKSFDVENEARRTLVTTIGGAVLLVGLFLTYRRLIAFERTVDVAQASQITERFSRAVDQLANEKLEARLGGIYALERIAQESEPDHAAVVEILAAFIREHAISREAVGRGRQAGPTAVPEALRLDIAAALKVLGRRTTYHKEYGYLDLERAVVPRADLRRAHLRNALLWMIDLERARLNGAHLGAADLRFGSFRGAALIAADLNLADARCASFDDADFQNADLSRANCEQAAFTYSYFGGATLRGGVFTQAKFHAADFGDADVSEAQFFESILFAADLQHTKNLTQEQVQFAYMDPETLLPEDIKRSEGKYFKDTPQVAERRPPGGRIEGRPRP